MATPIRRALFLALASLVAALTIGGAAYAVTEVGTNGNDKLIGTNQEDELSGRGGDDYLDGRGAADTLKGGSDEDRIMGNKGRDLIVGGRGTDDMLGNRGNDRIEADDGFHDYLNCGKGEDDKAFADNRDAVYNCEFVNGEPLDRNLEPGDLEIIED